MAALASAAVLNLDPTTATTLGFAGSLTLVGMCLLLCGDDAPQRKRKRKPRNRDCTETQRSKKRVDKQRGTKKSAKRSKDYKGIEADSLSD